MNPSWNEFTSKTHTYPVIIKMVIMTRRMERATGNRTYQSISKHVDKSHKTNYSCCYSQAVRKLLVNLSLKRCYSTLRGAENIELMVDPCKFKEMNSDLDLFETVGISLAC